MPAILQLIAIISLVLGVLCAAWIAYDETRHPQHMWIMNLVWPLTALFGSLIIVWFYLRHGRAAGHGHGHGHGHGADTPFPISVAKGVLHCGSGCTLGDIVAEWLLVLFPAIAVALGWQVIFPDKIFAAWIADYVFAFGFGIAFQYYSIKPMRSLSPRQGLIAALKADTLSLTAWQLGMYGFMAIAHFWIFGTLLGIALSPTSPVFWFMMQIAMLCGFVTAYPVNWWLIRVGIKEAM